MGAGTDITEVEPTLEDVIRLITRGELEQQYGPLPCKVTAYDLTKQTVSAQPLVLAVIAGEAAELPVLQDVQVIWPSAASFSLVAPLEAGDFGWLIPAGADISQWKTSGSENQPPDRWTRQDLSDVAFLPGSRPLSAPLTADRYSASGPVLYGDPLLLGNSGAAQFVALANLVLSELNKIKTAYDLHVHTVAAAPGTTSVPTVLMPAPSSVACTKVKAI